MAWSTSHRRAELPPDWDAVIRPRILQRDGYRCIALMPDGRRCGWKANQVDHIRPGDDHSDTNLQSLCSWHHGRKSAKEGQEAQRPRVTRTRPREPHPGLR